MNPIQAAHAAGQQIWLDNLSRALISSGELARFIELGVAGVTTNPAIFHKAIAEGQDYRPALAAMDASLGAEARYEGLVIEDVQRACDVIRPVFEASRGDAGYVSLEVSPALADDEDSRQSLSFIDAQARREAKERANYLSEANEHSLAYLGQARQFREQGRYELARQRYLQALSICADDQTLSIIKRELNGVELLLRTMR